MKGGDTWNMTISEETIVGNVILELMKKFHMQTQENVELDS